MWRIVWAAVIAVVIILLNTAILRAEPVSVQTLSGRVFQGEVDPRTDAERLWLRTDKDQASVYRPLDWSRVASVAQGTRKWSADEFKKQFQQVQTPRRVLESQESLPVPAAHMEAIPSSTSRRSQLEYRPVRSIQVDAQLGHWGPYVNADGLVLSLYPTDAQGQLVSASGTLEVEVLGQLPSGFPNGREFLRLGRWVQSVTLLDYGPTGAVVRLPFQAANPEFDRELGAKAIVHARFSVAGSGTFDASTPAVRVRAYNPLRDRLEQREGQRYFADEWTSRGDR